MVSSRRPFKSLPLRVSVRPYASADFSVDEDRAVARAADGDGYGTPSIDDMTRLRHRGARVISEGTGALAVAAKKKRRARVDPPSLETASPGMKFRAAWQA